jgi:hypothetical protein
VSTGWKALVAVLLGALAVVLTTAPTASARTFQVTYDWGDNRYGFEGWRPDNTPPGGVADGPWYSSTKTTGRGLRIVPTGGGDQPYRNTRGTWAWDPPGGASIRRVRLEGVSGTAVKRQFGRIWSIVEGEPADDRSAQRELTYQGATGNESESWDDRDFTLTTPAGERGLGFVLWLYTIPCETMEEPGACSRVSPADGAEMRMRKAVFTVDDPSGPEVALGGLPDETTWTRDRRVALRVTADDPQSGIVSSEATVRGGGAQRIVRLGRWTPDRFHTVARQPATPALPASRSVERVITVGREGTTRVSVATVNGAGMKTSRTGRVRVDRDRPTVSLPRKVKPSDAIRVADRPSGVREATLSVDGREQDRCTDARSCRLQVPSGVADRARVSVRVVDRAGNERTAARAATVPGAASDRRRPKISWPKSTKVGASVAVSDDRSGVAEATLTIADAPSAAVRCGDGGRRCKLKIPAEAAGKTIRVAAADQAGNRTIRSRRVASRACRPASSCRPPKAPKDSFLEYPNSNAVLWAGPLRFRWNRPAIKGVGAGTPLWYRLELDGAVVYEGQDLQYSVYAIDLGSHRWRVSVSRSRTGPASVKADRQFTMVEAGRPDGVPTDTDEAQGGAASTRSTTREGPFDRAPRHPVPENGEAARDLGERFVPHIKFDSEERWRPIRVANFISDERNALFYCTSKDLCADSGDKFISELRTSGRRCNGCAFDIAAENVKDNFKIGVSKDSSYQTSRRCQYGKDGYECAQEQPIYHTIQYLAGRQEYVVSYWWFYRYNDGFYGGVSDHEGDWEGLNVYVSARTKAATHVVFDQHGHPSRRAIRRHDWTATTHVGAYPAKGRHATYAWKGRGRDAIPKGDFTEIHKGQKDWWGNKLRGCGGRTCLHKYPTAKRGSLSETPVPKGLWASFQGKWGASGPDSPGRGGNEKRFKDPVGYLTETFPGGREQSRAAARAVGASEPGQAPAAENCHPLWGGGSSVVACGASRPGPLGSISIVDRRGAVRERSTIEGVENFTEADIISDALEAGEAVTVEGPTPEGTGVMALVQGRDLEPYVMEADVPVLESGQRWMLRITSNGRGVIGAGGDAQTVRILPGLAPDLEETATLRVRGRTGRLYVAGPTGTIRYVAENREGRRLGPARVRSRVLHGPYRKLDLALPRGTRQVAAYVGQTRRLLFRVAANQPVQEVTRPKRAPGGSAGGNGAGRPTQ